MRRPSPGWLALTDLALLGLVVVILAVDGGQEFDSALYFGLIIQSFFWDVRFFAVRAAFWGSLIAVVLTTLIVTDREPPTDLIDLAMLLAVLALVYVINSRRAAAAREIDRLITEQRNQLERLADLAELKADFTAMVVHEFGNPLAALRRLNEMMRFEGLDPEARAFVLESTRTELGVLETLVADVSATVAVEREGFRVELHAVPIAALAEQAETYGRSVCGDHVFSVTVDPELIDRSVRADSDRIAQVIRNLVSNATKYSSVGSAISVAMHRTGPGIVRIEVADEGRGISAADLERIFDKFGRADSAGGTRVPGVGLGLYICRRLVLSHGSDLTVRSDVGKGSVFGFDLALVGPDEEVR